MRAPGPLGTGGQVGAHGAATGTGALVADEDRGTSVEWLNEADKAKRALDKEGGALPGWG